MSDIRFLIQDYLSHLKERDELDAILPDLLRSMGFQIVKLAFRGEVEHGVDLAAYASDSSGGTLLLIQVKPGDIDQHLWDSGPNSVRATLNNLLDVPFVDLTKPKLQTAKKKVILAHNGILRENIRDKFNGYIENSFSPHMDFERWGLDDLAFRYEKHLLNERILLKEQQRLLKRTLIFLDVSDYDLSDYKQLLSAQLKPGTKITKKSRERTFSVIKLILAMILNHCKENNNLTFAIEIYELTLLQLWGWMLSNAIITPLTLNEYIQIYFRYLDLLTEWALKLEPAINTHNGLFWGGSEEKVEYPLRTFKVIGSLGFLTTELSQINNEEIKEKLFPKIAGLLTNVITNNPSRHRPLLDNHLIDIFLGLLGLLRAGREDLTKQWIIDIFEHLIARKRIMQRLPELHNNIDAVLEYEATDDRPLQYVDSSSTLLYFLFEICLIFNLKAEYQKYRIEFQDINLQIWYPPENVEEFLYFREIHEGDTETINQLPEDFEEFLEDVRARHSFDHENYSPIKEGLPMILLLACKYYRTPIFPFWWRNTLFPHTDSKDIETRSK